MAALLHEVLPVSITLLTVSTIALEKIPRCISKGVAAKRPGDLRCVAWRCGALTAPYRRLALACARRKSAPHRPLVKGGGREAAGGLRCVDDGAVRCVYRTPRMVCAARTDGAR